MSKQQTAVEFLIKEFSEILGPLKTEPMQDLLLMAAMREAKQMEKECASTFGIRVTSECCTLKNGKMEVDLHKFETLLNEMYGE